MTTNTHPPSLILASSSEPRQALLSRLQIPFSIAIPNIDETPLPNETPDNLVLRLAEAKAKRVASAFPNALIIGADQVGVLNQEIQCKPHTYENATKQLLAASGQRLVFFIGLCLLDTRNNTKQIALEKFAVIYKNLTPQIIQNYLHKEQPYASAGSCKAEGLGITLIKAFQGEDYTALIGLPLIRLTTLLEKANLNPLTF